ncbi:hypothetical protein AVEN_73472-1 [Araneus ventricosus]|uniref:Uncharacterized protein n=1 Tax=Araneus ventricosus TaxID=182803 RepID=A0A4Y2P9B7_ARAVE|nr:hypothetical protein AVEN_73472-1 [Araneus ventricosus]
MPFSMHAATECDTTSAIFRKEKYRELHLITKNREMPSLILQFNSPQLDPLKALILAIHPLQYGSKQNPSLQNLTWQLFHQVQQLLSIHFVFNFKSNNGWKTTWILQNGDGS